MKKIYELTLQECMTLCKRNISRTACAKCPINRECIRFLHVPPCYWEIDAEVEVSSEDYK